MLLRKLADNGQAILCTIHQPSSQLFRIFDRLLLLNSHSSALCGHARDLWQVDDTPYREVRYG
ncbi:hypothetical protein F4778DRAFT_367759 [Xylariomycetidae sp. FL2044]|nr:hypothetical protein F4778DRAFT_367759 [Xylariomycetidae sp. FL2044]